MSGDNDSLFGSPSPPSSPTRGRSPALALPQGDNALQNVGTIALPGSHLFSELVAHNPTALSLSHSQKSAHRPPAQSQTNQRQHQHQIARPQAQPRASSSQSSRQGQSANANKKKKTSRENSTAPPAPTRPPPPPIHLPDPNAPPPANFLRNQQALLGLAGLIGHVKPSRLTRVRESGDKGNPIIVDEADEVGNSNGQGKKVRIEKEKEVMRPSNEEIVGMLIRDRNVLPILESILQLINKHVPSHSSTKSPEPASEPAPPSKKRKLNPGITMEQDQTKHLLSQLCTMIKSAAHKATLAKNPHVNVANAKSRKFEPRFLPPQEDKIMGHYRARTAHYGKGAVRGTGTGEEQEVLVDKGNTVRREQTSPVPSSLGFGPGIAMNIDMDVGSSQGPASSTGETSFTPDFSSPTPEFDSAAFDSWMSVLEMFPEPVVEGNWDTDMESLFAGGSTPGDTPFESFSPSGTPDFAIDPVLLGLAPPPPPPPSQPPSFGIIPPLPPLTSTSTSPTNTDSTMDPITPVGQGQEMGHERGTFFDPELERIIAQMGGVDSIGGKGIFDGREDFGMDIGGAGVGGTSFADMGLEGWSTEMMAWQDSFIQFDSNPNENTNVGTASSDIPIDPVLASFSIPTRPSLPLNTQPLAPIAGPSSQPSPIPSTAGPSSQPPPPAFKMPARVNSATRIPNASKQDILRRAKERRMQLLGEIDKAKVELWETTIEQGVLANIIKEKI